MEYADGRCPDVVIALLGIVIVADASSDTHDAQIVLSATQIRSRTRSSRCCWSTPAARWRILTGDAWAALEDERGVGTFTAHAHLSEVSTNQRNQRSSPLPALDILRLAERGE
ncbi:hypothetical protein SCP_0602470 [Sparassis crispa]|uniref:Uncharacterized protein n=1 Tax=Sparassis crispa TaxID=139825 RepID=A0A401GQ46_9APHY|nr:hypothetical protein SCP_0602470 [Sparassis crispa]GBE84269.1 hypothetical protein SCP_0602470 [Sparassis crispa]